MKRNTTVITLFLSLVLTACAAPVQVAPQPAPQLDLQVPATGAPEEERAAPAHLPTQPPAQPAFSTAPLSDRILLTSYNREKRLTELHAMDPATGLDIAGYEPISLGGSYAYASSPDRATLAVVAYAAESIPWGGVLRLIDLQRWQDAATEVTLDGWGTSRMAFTQDGTRLAIATMHFADKTHRIITLDVASQTVAAQIELDFNASTLEYVLDEQFLLVYGSQEDPTPEDLGDLSPEPRIALLNPADLSVVWQLELPEILDGVYVEYYTSHTLWMPAVVLSADRSKLYIVHADDERLTTVDLQASAASTVEIRPSQSWLERLFVLTAGVAHAKMMNQTVKEAVLSADGKRLFVTGWSILTTYPEGLDLQVIDVSNGTEIARVEAELSATIPVDHSRPNPVGVSGSQIALSSDGTRLYLRGGAEAIWTDVLDAVSLERVERVKGGELLPSLTLGGKPILLSAQGLNSQGQTRLTMFDPQTLEPFHTWFTPGDAQWIVMP